MTSSTCDPHHPLLIGCAAGFSGDRTDAAGPVVETLIAAGGAGACLIFETLAERTLALAQLRRRADPDAGYEPLLDAMLRPVLARCLAHGIRIVSNFGAANPRGAARRIARMARELGLRAPRIAVVEGDDLSAPGAPRAAARAARRAAATASRIVSANAYLGAEPIAAALRCRRADRGCGPRRRSVAGRRPGDGALRLGARRLGPAGPRHHGRPPARMRRAGQRRLLRRPRLQGRARTWRTSAFRSPRSTPTAAASIGKADGTGGLRRRAAR